MPAPTNAYQPYAALHAATHGAGDQRPTAMRVLFDEGLLHNGLVGKVFLVTGCSAGLGVETARALYAAGADVYMTVREAKKQQAEKIIKDIRSSAPQATGKLELVFLDLTSFKSVRAGAEDFLKRTTKLNALIENAGVMMCPYSKTEDGFEMQMGTNHFGHFLLFQCLKERLLASATPEFRSRVIVVSSAGHRFSEIRFDDVNFEAGYDRIAAYGQSKTANVYMASSIERHYGHLGLRALSVHPGVILETDLPRHQTMETVDQDFDMASLIPIAKNIPQGAASQVWAATAKHFNDGAGYYVADCGVGIPWKEGDSVGAAGYAAHAYDEVKEERLWKLSCDAVGVGYD